LPVAQSPQIPFSQEMNMTYTNIKLTGLLASIILTFCSFGAYAEESQEKSNINKDQVEGRVEEAKGKVKEVTGKALDDKGMEIKGNIQKNVGKAQAGYGDLKKDIKDGK
jgi:uncharacterized protein YjbJ (UPF0337 family)